MRKIDLNLSLNPYLAFFFVAVVGSGASLVILRALEATSELTAYMVLP